MQLTNYRVLRSNIDSPKLYITKNLEVVVYAPMKADYGTLDQFVEDNEKWINEKKKIRSMQQKSREKFTKSIGDSLLFLGKEVEIEESKNNEVGFDGERFFIPRGTGFEEAKPIFIRVYQVMAEQIIPAICNLYNYEYDIELNSVKIINSLNQWSTFNREGEMGFSWILMMAEKKQIEYVVVHTMCHLIEKNHTPKFWELVEELIPKYKEEEHKLKILAQRISTENWECEE